MGRPDNALVQPNNRSRANLLFSVDWPEWPAACLQIFLGQHVPAHTEWLTSSLQYAASYGRIKAL